MIARHTKSRAAATLALSESARPKLADQGPTRAFRFASRATIAFLQSDRPDAPRAGDAYGDGGHLSVSAGSEGG
jgi:hypothetical protein